ncbi:hypothetical protein O181_092589 [Austropuccinia psidii MF-1]|uniref:Uncharacterized protein n=1 Tax=Austropuccinia psidii MF-1 TaxID=1389203 RepID=A0A9Q3P912_9BASI|nr:hypothetical protein [Austropuccinia psidii MF-1]
MEGKQPSTTQTESKTSLSSQQQQFQCEEAATISEQRKSTRHNPIQPGLHNPKDMTACHGKFVSDGQNHDGITEKRGSKITISGMISDILDGIAEEIGSQMKISKMFLEF